MSVIDESASAIRDRVASGQMSAIDVLAETRVRIERLNPTLNAVVTPNPRADDEARAVDRAIAGGARPGLLAGVPVGIKDVTPVAGVRTTFGSPMYADHVPVEDALVVARLRAAGAVIVGKTNCPEFAAGGNTFNDVFGRTRNPWNPALSAGGSTGGGAAALASGMIALAEGTDLGGSLRIPASFCGLVGLRPSVGLVPTVPSDWLWDTLQVTGPMARTAADAALMLQAIAGPDARAPLSQGGGAHDFPAAARGGVRRGSRLVYVPDPARIGVDQTIDRVCRQSLEGFVDAGCLVDDLDLDVAFARDAFLTLRGLWFVAHMYPRLDRRAEFGVNVGNNVRAGLGMSVEDVARAESARARFRQVALQIFDRYDAIVTPTMAVPPFPVEENYPTAIAGRPMQTYVDWIAPTFIWSLLGVPVGSVPAGLDPSGMPVGLQIVGPPAGDERVLSLMATVEAARPIGRPDVSRLA